MKAIVSKSNQYFAAKKAVERADSTTGAVSDLIRVVSENIASFPGHLTVRLHIWTMRHALSASFLEVTAIQRCLLSAARCIPQPSDPGAASRTLSTFSGGG
jgi:hypothetical protein